MSEPKIEFINNSAKWCEKLDAVALQWLEESKASLSAQASKNSKIGRYQGGALAQSFITDSQVSSPDKTAYIGSTLEYAIWQEYGTGEYALDNKGRKGGWWIKVGSGTNQISPVIAEAYKDKWAQIRYDENGNMTYVFTRGSLPRRMLYNAFNTKRDGLINRAKELFGGVK